MRLAPAIFAAGLAVLPAQAQQIGPVTPVGARTVQAFLAGCAADRYACQLVVGTALLNKLSIGEGPAQLCHLNGEDLGAAVTGWLRDHPQTRSLPVDEAIFAALESLYPCGPPVLQVAVQ